MPDQPSAYLQRKRKKQRDEARPLARLLAAHGYPVDQSLLDETLTRKTRKRRKKEVPAEKDDAGPSGMTEAMSDGLDANQKVTLPPSLDVCALEEGKAAFALGYFFRTDDSKENMEAKWAELTDEGRLGWIQVAQQTEFKLLVGRLQDT